MKQLEHTTLVSDQRLNCNLWTLRTTLVREGKHLKDLQMKDAEQWEDVVLNTLKEYCGI